MANGNTLVVDPEGLEVFEVTEKKQIVWKWVASASPPQSDPSGVDLPAFTMARRYALDEMTFFKEIPNVPSR